MLARARYLLVLALFSWGCGGGQLASAPERSEPQPEAQPASPAAEKPGAPAEQELARDEDRSLESELEEFERARLELGRVLGRDLEAPVAEAPSSAREDRTSTGAGAPPPAAAPSRSRAPSDDAEAKPKALKKGEDSCGTVCRAFGSLARSAAAVCRIDGQTERCRRASHIVEVAEADPGVRTCGCQR